MHFPKSVFLTILILTSGLFAQSEDEQIVRHLTEQYAQAIIERNIDKFSAANNLDGYWRNQWQKSFENGEYAQYPVRSQTIKWIRIDGDNAIVRVFWDRADAQTNKPHVEFHMNHRVFYLQKIDSVWKVINQTSAENDLISRIVTTPSIDERKRLILSEPELNTHRIIFVILFRLQSDGKFEETEEFYRLADWYNEEFFGSGKDEFRFVNTVLNVLNSRALTQKSLGNFGEAMRLYSKSAMIAEEYQSKSKRILGGTALTQVNIGSLYFQLGNPEQAEAFAVAALKSLENADRVKQAVLFNSIYTLLGDVSLERGDDAKALEYYQLARSDDSHGIGTIYLRQGRLVEALAIFEKSVEKEERSAARKEQVKLPLVVGALVRISEIHRRRNNNDEALKSALRSVEFAVQSKNPELMIFAETALGNTQLQAGRLKEAESSFLNAIDIIESGRSDPIGGEAAKIDFLGSRIEPFHRMVELMSKRGDVSAALEFSEKGKSRVLNDILRNGKIDWQAVLDDPDRKKEAELRNNLSRLNRQQTVLKYGTLSDPTELSEITKRIDQARLDYEFFQTAAFAKYAELGRSRGLTGVLKPDEIGQMITGPRQALIEFEFTDNRAFIFVVTRSVEGSLHVQAQELEGSANIINSLVRQFREQLINKELNFKASARTLFDRLFGRIGSQLEGKNELIVVPDGELWGLPFSALVETDGRYLIEKRSVQFVQSITALRELRSIKRPVRSIPGPIMAIGNPRLNPELIGKVADQYRGVLGDLPESEAEVFEIRRIFGQNGRFLTRSEAREDVWKAEAPNFAFLHLATHGVANPLKPLYSHLFLSTTPESRDDGLLEAWEVMNLRLNAEMAVLSACETGRGQIRNGEGMIGLTWAFAVAGVPQITSSLWKVESAGTGLLMADFHRQLRKRRTDPPSKSLQSAMIGLMKRPDYRHPFYWAGFVAIGK